MKGHASRLFLWSFLLIGVIAGCSDDPGVTPAPSLSPSTSTPAPPVTSTPLPPATNTPAPPAANTPIPPITSTPTPPAASTPAPVITNTPTSTERPALNIQFIGAADLSDESKLSLADLIESIQAGVVQITTSSGSASGFIISSDGLVITSEHVVSGESSVGVWLTNGRRYDANVLELDATSDLALLRIDGGGSYDAIAVGDPNTVRMGHEVLALGFPLADTIGTNLTVTRGIISSTRVEDGVQLIQTDASLNPGSSGGPLVNRDGEVIGVNTSRIEETDSGRPVSNIGFAVSVSELQRRLPTLGGQIVDSNTPTPALTPTSTAEPTWTPAPTFTPEPTSTPTLTQTIQPPETPVQALPSPTPTPMPERKIVRIIAHFQGQIDEAVQESSCYVDRDIEGTISHFSTKSIIHLRAFTNTPDLSASDVQAIVDYLEGQSGRHDRLCEQERGYRVPVVKDASDIITYYGENFATYHNKGRTCEVAERAGELVFGLLSSNINYIRGYFDAPKLNREDLLHLIAHLESESGRYASLCARNR